jgi:prepilin-type processing-associated H-X9-DG protein
MITDRNPTKAFTVLELLITIAVLMLVAAILLPALTPAHTCQRINCTNNLKQVELSFRTWALDNQDQLPMQVAVTNGGARELIAQGMVFPIFQVMSNELSTPKILICPQDAKRNPAANFASLTDKQVSYFVCQNPSEAGNPGLLSGDRNLTNALVPGIHAVAFTTNLSLGWSKEMHSRQGNVAFTDGRVEQFRNGAFILTRKGREVRSNRLLLP